MLIAMFTRNSDGTLSVMDIREPLPRYRARWFSRSIREFLRFDDIAEIRIYPTHDIGPAATYRIVAQR